MEKDEKNLPTMVCGCEVTDEDWKRLQDAINEFTHILLSAIVEAIKSVDEGEEDD